MKRSSFLSSVAAAIVATCSTLPVAMGQPVSAAPSDVGAPTSPAELSATNDATAEEDAAGSPSESASSEESPPESQPTQPQEVDETLSPDPSDDSAPSDESFNLKLRNIEERVNALKEKIFRSKARLIQLQEVVLHGAITGSKAILIHRNEMGSSFRLRRVQYSLDGAPIFNRVDTGDGELNDAEEIEIFNGSIAPGNHQISVYLEYQGHGYGFFSYLKGYRFKIKSSFTFDAEEGKLTTVRIVGFEKGGLTTGLKDRPAVRYDLESTRALRENQPEQPLESKAADGVEATR